MLRNNEMRGIEVYHAAIQRWVFKFAPLIESEFKKRKSRVEASWIMDETYMKVKGIWCYLYRVVDKTGNTVDSKMLSLRSCSPLYVPIFCAETQHKSIPTSIGARVDGEPFFVLESCTLKPIAVISL